MQRIEDETWKKLKEYHWFDVFISDYFFLKELLISLVIILCVMLSTVILHKRTNPHSLGLSSDSNKQQTNQWTRETIMYTLIKDKSRHGKSHYRRCHSDKRQYSQRWENRYHFEYILKCIVYQKYLMEPPTVSHGFGYGYHITYRWLCPRLQ